LATKSRAPPIEIAAPFLFLALWSGGYVVAKIAILDVTPVTLVVLRFAITLVLFLAVALALSAPWPSRHALVPIATTGLLIQGCYFLGSFLAFGQGIAAGALALIMALQPILTACVAGPLLGERVRPPQWLGLALGLVGVVLVLQSKLAQGYGTLAGVGFGLFGLAAITVGTLFQKRHCPQFDLWTGGVIQFAAATLLALPVALLLETPRLEPTPRLAWALGYLVIGNSLIATSMLNLMIRRGEASRITSLLYLVPGGAALLAWPVLGETMTPPALVGLAIGAAGVALVLRTRPSR
jgi:drug/metabolite transporter (DMT)-like permease